MVGTSQGHELNLKDIVKHQRDKVRPSKRETDGPYKTYTLRGVTTLHYVNSDDWRGRPFVRIKLVILV